MIKYVFKHEKLKERRLALNMSIRMLADKADINYSGLSRIEKGERDPVASSVGSLAGALGVTPNHFYEKERKKS